MSENLQRFTRSAHTLRNVAVRVPSGAWDNDSCCDGWSAREVAGHASWVLQNIAASTGHGERPEKQPEAEVAGDDPAATVCASVDACLLVCDLAGTAKVAEMRSMDCEVISRPQFGQSGTPMLANSSRR